MDFRDVIGKIGFVALFLAQISLARAQASPLTNEAIQKLPRSRFCVLQFKGSSGTSFDILSGVLINDHQILSVGHTLFQNTVPQIKCDNKRILVRDIYFHPKYDYRPNPPQMKNWARYDYSLTQTQAQSSDSEIGFLEDKLSIKNLIQSGQCYFAGAGYAAGDDVRTRKMKVEVLPSSLGPETVTHVTVVYKGSPRIVSGDSGGPVICWSENQWKLVGLLEYAGHIAQSKNQSSPLNIVGIALLRDEIIRDLKIQ